MTRARWFIASLWLLLFWLIAGAVWIPAIQNQLQAKAEQSIGNIQTGYPPINIRFDGQVAHLAGQVRNAQQRQQIENHIATRLTQSGYLPTELNPVTGVRNEIEVRPYSPGWLLLAAQGPRAVLYGTLASDEESRDLSRLSQEIWDKQRGRLTGVIKVNAPRFDEAPGIQTTLDQLPPPLLDQTTDTAQVYVTALGRGWEKLPLELDDSALREKTTAYPITEEEWKETLLPALARTRRYLQTERARVAESKRQSKLAPPHIFFAARDQRLLLRGEVATLKIKREFLNTVIGSFHDWRVIDDIRVNDQRREVADFGPITTALLPLKTDEATSKTLALGLSGAAWEFQNWQTAEEPPQWARALPKDLPVSLLKEDHRMVMQWLQGSAQGIPALAIPAQPSFLTLTLLSDKVILAGQLAEEPLRVKLIESVRRAYSGKVSLMTDALLARGTCEPTEDVEQTIRSLPPLPNKNEAPVLAFARPGQVWKSQEATEDLLKPGALSESELMPADFPAAMAEDTFIAESYDHLRHYWKAQSAPAPKNTPR